MMRNSNLFNSMSRMRALNSQFAKGPLLQSQQGTFVTQASSDKYIYYDTSRCAVNFKNDTHEAKF